MMQVQPLASSLRRNILALPAALLLAAAALGSAQTQSSASNPYFGSVTVMQVTDTPLRLSLDDAVARGLKTNLGLREAEAGELQLRGLKNQALQQFLPTMTLTGGTGVHVHNLQAEGFGPSVLAKFGSVFPGGFPPGLSYITKDDLTQGQINFSQTLFSGPVIAGYKAAKAAENVAYFSKMTARGEVVQQVATAYLRTITAQSEVENRTSQERADHLAFDHASEALQAGTVPRLDMLRARVQWESQQQALIAAQNEHEKDLILLKREIGIAPGQKIELTDAAPYSDLTEQTPDEVLTTAYKNRQDWQNLQNQVIALKAEHAAYRAERLPSLKFHGYWGTDTVNGAGTHGNFAAVGTLSVPIFREASLRGNEDAAEAQLDAVRNQLGDLREHINQQVRSSILDAQAAEKLVSVARSNVELARQALSDESDRVQAGVDDNLPLVTAQASLATAESNLIESLYQYNIAKLNLARSAGVIELQYKQYLGK